MSKSSTGTSATPFNHDPICVIGGLFRDLAWLLILGGVVLGTFFFLLLLFLQIEESVAVTFLEGTGR